MGVLFDLPRELQLCVLNEWLRVKDMPAVEVACGRKHREELLSMLREPMFDFYLAFMRGGVPCVRWASKRRLPIRRLVLDSFDLLDLAAIPDLYLAHVTEVEIFEDCDSDESDSDSGSQGEQRANWDHVKKVFSRLSALRSLVILTFPVTNQLMAAMLSSLPAGTLKAINVVSEDAAFLSASVLVELLPRSLESCCFHETPFDSSSLTALAAKCTQLTEVDVSLPRLRRPEALVEFCAALPALSKVSLLETAANLTADLLKRMLSKLSNAVELNIYSTYSATGSRECFNTALVHCPRLQSLVTNGYYYVHRQGGRRQLLFYKNDNSEDDIVKVLADCSLPLNVVRLGDSCDAMVLETLGSQHGHSLLKFSAPIDIQIPSQVWATFFGQCSLLLQLVLSCRYLRDEDFEGLPIACPLLEELRVYYAVALTDSGVQHVLSACALKVLSLNGCALISDMTLTHIINSKTQRLSLVELCDTSVSAQSVLDFVEHAASHQLQCVKVSKVKFTDEAAVPKKISCIGRWNTVFDEVVPMF